MGRGPWMEGEGDGNTPLDENESVGLVPSHIATRSELNEWESRNIEEALDWIISRTPDVLNEGVLRTLHRKMFDKTWEWAGTYRTSDKGISPFHWSEVPRRVHDLLTNTRVQCGHAAGSPEALDELAARFHHELVRIHPWSNGNGRHARLAADVLLHQWGRPHFSWGSATNYPDRSALRTSYLAALRDADAGSYDKLLRFVRS